MTTTPSTPSTPDDGASQGVVRPDRRQRHQWTWRREVLELSILFMGVGSAGMFTELLGQRHYGWATLVAVGCCLLGASALHWWWKARGPGRLRDAVHVRPAVGPIALPVGWDDSGAELQLWRIRAVVRDTPGSLASVCGRLADVGVNILGLQVHPLGDGVLDEFLVDVPLGVTAADLAEIVAGGGAADARIDRADARDLADAPARILALAARLAGGTAGLPSVLHDLFGECSVVWAPGDPGESTYQGTEMSLADPDGGTLRIGREGPAFTPTEFARAQALIALCIELRRTRLVE